MKYFQGFLFDIYLHKESSEEPPYYVGFSYVLPNNMKYSNGLIVIPITSVRHKPIGELKSKNTCTISICVVFLINLCIIPVNYLIINPTKEIYCNLKKMNLINRKNSYVPLDIGHRGSGSSFQKIEYE